LERIILCLEKPDARQDDLNKEFGIDSEVSIKVSDSPMELSKNEKNSVYGLFTKLSVCITDDLVQQFPNLVVIGTPTTGRDHINISAQNTKKIQLVTLSKFPDVIRSFSSTVEVAWWHILELSRHCSKFEDLIEKEIWNRYAYSHSSFRGKTLGVVGLGRLGDKVAQIAKSFGLRVIFSEIDLERINIGKLNGYEFVTLEKIFEIANIISLHVDDRKSNLKLINSNLLQCIDTNFPILINTSRGFIVDEEAIVESLEKGKLRGFGADVLTNEQVFSHNKNLRNNIIWQAKYSKNLPITITPHIGGATTDSMNLSSVMTLIEMRTVILQ
jgi:phosphoglycerate dehydrogenase-like enzyme